MARKRSKSSNYSSSNKRTASEVKQSFSKQEWEQMMFERSKAALQLVDPSKTSNRTISTFSKETLRTYMENPLSQYKNLRNLSRFLYYRSQVYRRLVNYNANMINLNYRTVVPIHDLVEDVSNEDILSNFNDTLKILEHMNLPLEFLKAYITAWREDVFYGCAYLDETGFFILPLDPDYCKVTGIYKTGGDLGFDMDMSYFSNRQDQLEMWGEPFTTMYNDYVNDRANGKWQPMPDANCVCLKVNVDDWEIPLPPYMGLFNSLINLEDLAEIEAIASEQNIYKLLVATIPTINNTNEVDDFAIDVNTAIEYFNKMTDSLPNYADAIITPIPIEPITFDKDQATDVNKIENATKSVLTVSGGIQTLCPPSGTTAYTAAIRSDQEFAISALLPQTQAIVNRLLDFQLEGHARIKFLEVTEYTKDAYKESLIKDLNYGLPFSMTIGSLNGYSELEMISMAKLQSALDIESLFKPLQTAATRSAEDTKLSNGDVQPEGGGQEKNLEDLTDEGEASRDKAENKN